MLEQFSLNGKTAVVTGGSSGIGLGIARGLAAAGADLVLIARGEQRLEGARDKLASVTTNVTTRTFDMSQLEDIASLYQAVVDDTGGADILVNAAGMSPRRVSAEDAGDDEWQAAIDLNLTAVFRMCRAFARERIASGRPGKIINVASLQGERARQNNTAYAASKGGIRQLTKQLAVDWAQYRILVNAIGPGYVRTELTRPLWESEEFTRWVVEKTPLGRWSEPEDLAGAAVFLASAASDFMTGQILYVDGGWLALM